ncbi:hypothetical protein CAOG_02267 [Capsaspora owczarzaki ATCC 30864]|uniref:Uncharacterized protein n=1 Tax=Capsaspora owczarzaki (strain ATCC 30864) TaxID=595528 RepID=A0A0D2WKZ0_CAPO3|nr:hypothetical protein CAOG_02267 [Capsaspora owczarzaki ATCC 30864]KJE91075.1 hypothetical protein CAOG_002267 [Capsaspora owczarzaki ATCC 30864]|eukprot:XP_004349017.1 hypothetical protein CAOG_02267 [Capsaspora owczarzaki ATCC 30864]
MAAVRLGLKPSVQPPRRLRSTLALAVAVAVAVAAMLMAAVVGLAFADEASSGARSSPSSHQGQPKIVLRDVHGRLPPPVMRVSAEEWAARMPLPDPALLKDPPPLYGTEAYFAAERAAKEAAAAAAAGQTDENSSKKPKKKKKKALDEDAYEASIEHFKHVDEQVVDGLVQDEDQEQPATASSGTKHDKASSGRRGSSSSSSDVKKPVNPFQTTSKTKRYQFERNVHHRSAQLAPRPEPDPADPLGGFASDSEERKDFLDMLKRYKDLDEAVQDDTRDLVTYNLGLMYFLGHGTRRDRVRAVELYTEAAHQGLAVAMNDLGWCYMNGVAVSKNEEEGVRWYREAAEIGLREARTNLGMCYLAGSCGVGVANSTEALKWFMMAALDGVPMAQAQGGLLLIERGTRERTNAAHQVMQEQMDRHLTAYQRDGDDNADDNEAAPPPQFRPTLAMEKEIEEKIGNTGLDDMSRGLAWLQFAADELDGDADGGLPFAQHALAMQHIRPASAVLSVLERNATRALELLELAARTNYPPAVSELVSLHKNGIRAMQPFRPRAEFRQPSGIPIKKPDTGELKRIFERDVYELVYRTPAPASLTSAASSERLPRGLSALPLAISPPVAEQDKVVRRNPQKYLDYLHAAVELNVTDALLELATLHHYGSEAIFNPPPPSDDQLQGLSEQDRARFLAQRNNRPPVVPHRPIPSDLALALDYYKKSGESGNPQAYPILVAFYQRGMGTTPSLAKAAFWQDKINTYEAQLHAEERRAQLEQNAARAARRTDIGRQASGDGQSDIQASTPQTQPRRVTRIAKSKRLAEALSDEF